MNTDSKPKTVMPPEAEPETEEVMPEDTGAPPPPMSARTQDRTRLLVGLAGLAVVAVILTLALISNAPGPRRARSNQPNLGRVQEEKATAEAARSVVPITEAARPVADAGIPGAVSSGDIAGTAAERPPTPPARAAAAARPTENLGSIPPFPNSEAWKPAPERTPATRPVSGKDAVDESGFGKPSLVFVRGSGRGRAEAPAGVKPAATGDADEDQETNLGLPAGTRLAARLQSMVTTAVPMPVVAVIEYNYERQGGVLIPAGARVIGSVQQANRSGHVAIQFRSLVMPDGRTVPVEAVAADLSLGPLKGQVEGRRTGARVLARSLTGVGIAASSVLGLRGGLGGWNDPLNQSALLRERVANNVAQAGETELQRLAIQQNLVVSVPGNTRLYVVLQRAARAVATAAAAPSGSELQELMQLRNELSRLVRENSVHEKP